VSSAPLIPHTPTASGHTTSAPGGGPGPVVPRRVAGAASTRPRDPATGLPLIVLLAIPMLVTAWGMPYYAAPAMRRLRHPLHAMLKASGPVGLAFGVLALLLFVFMWLYPLRKQARWLAWTGSLGKWMNVHIVMGLALPFIAAVHAGWHFDGLIGLGMLAMVIVSLSGIVGRYLYVHIPRSRSGLELSLEEAGGERRALLTELAVATGMTPQDAERALALDPRPYENLGLARTFARLVTDDFTRWRTLRRLSREWSRAGQRQAPLDPAALASALRLARLELKLSQQMRALDATRRVFAWWHIAHRPFALTALFAVIIHVVVAVWVGGVRLSPFGTP
jgi:hypothetical protein